MAADPTLKTAGDHETTTPGGLDASSGQADERASDRSSGGPRRRPLKQWLPWAITAVACIVALAAVAYAVRAGDAQDSGDTDGNGPVSLAGDGSSAGGSTASKPGSTGSGSTATKPSTPGGSSAGSGSSSGGTASGSSAGQQGAKTITIAPSGSTLATISAPPSHTVGLLKIPDGVKSATYSVTFKPYGWGPGGPDRGNLVVNVVKSTPTGGEASKLTDLTGKNASLWATPEVASAIKVGGAYSGSITVRIDGDTGRLLLVAAKPAS